MLLELSVVEQGYQAVLAMIRDGVPIVEVAHRFDVSRQAVHRWLGWYEAQGLPVLVDRSHRPTRCSHQMDPSVEVWVLEARRRNPNWGPRRLVHEAARAGIEPNVAVETGLYDVSDASGERSTAVEEHLTTIEGPAMAAMGRIDDNGRPPPQGTPDRQALGRYLRLQSTRTPETRERIFFSRGVANYAGDREITKELIAEYLETVWGTSSTTRILPSPFIGCVRRSAAERCR